MLTRDIQRGMRVRMLYTPGLTYKHPQHHSRQWRRVRRLPQYQETRTYHTVCYQWVISVSSEMAR